MYWEVQMMNQNVKLIFKWSLNQSWVIKLFSNSDFSKNIVFPHLADWRVFQLDPGPWAHEEEENVVIGETTTVETLNV